MAEYILKIDQSLQPSQEALSVYSRLNELLPNKHEYIQNWSCGSALGPEQTPSKKWRGEVSTRLSYLCNNGMSNGRIRNPSDPQPLTVLFDDSKPGQLEVKSTELSVDEIVEALKRFA